MVNEWAGTATAYAASFERLCAGTIGAMLEAVGAPRGRLLDVGCGTGPLAAAAADAGWRVDAVDAESSMLELARSRHPRLSFTSGALPRLPFADGAFDAVTANFVVNHVADPRAAVRELSRLAAAGAPVAVAVWPDGASPLNALWQAVSEEAEAVPPPGRRLPPELDFARTPEGLAGLLVDGGLAGSRVRELEWTFEIEPEPLWASVEAGIAGIGRTFRAQDAATRARMHAAYRSRAEPMLDGGVLRLRSCALVGVGAV